LEPHNRAIHRPLPGRQAHKTSSFIVTISSRLK
jgi:hypothetical protein